MGIQILLKFSFLIFRKSQKVSKLYVYPFKSARQYLERVVKSNPPTPPAMDRVKDNLKNEDDVRKEDSLEMKTHTAPPLRPSVVLVSIEINLYIKIAAKPNKMHQIEQMYG